MAPKPDPMHAPQIKPIMTPTLPPAFPPMKRPARPTPTVQKTLFILSPTSESRSTKPYVPSLQHRWGTPVEFRSLGTVHVKCAHESQYLFAWKFKISNSVASSRQEDSEVPSKSNPSTDRSTQWDHSDHYSGPLRLCESRPTTRPVRSPSWHRMVLFRLRCLNNLQLYKPGPCSQDTSNL